MDIIAKVKDATGIELPEGTLYTTLGGLQREGLLRVWTMSPGKRRGRPRTYYELTARGTTAAMRYRSMITRLLGLKDAGEPGTDPRDMGERFGEFVGLSDEES
jgi:DNA-binding PadR family transcriptional regulator